MKISWPDLWFPPINLWNRPKNNFDYKYVQILPIGEYKLIAKQEKQNLEKDPRVPPPDFVNHPPHYTNHPSGVECLQITEHMSFLLGNAIKYIWRADLKNGVEDLSKAVFYLNREIANRKK